MWMAVLILVQQATAAPIRLEIDRIIGTDDHPTLAFSEISDLAASPDGSIFIAQPMDGQVVVIGPDVNVVARLGGQGRGPGEFESIHALQYWHGGVVATDLRLGRTTTLGRDGSVQDIQRMPSRVPDGFVPRPPFGRLGDAMYAGTPGYRVTSNDSLSLPLFVIRAGEYGRQLTMLASGSHLRRVERAELVMVIPQPVSSNSLWEVAPDGRGVVVVHRPAAIDDARSEFSVEKFDADGSLAYRRTFAYTPERIPSQNLEQERERLANDLASRRPFPRALIAEMYREGYQVPDFQAAVDQLVVATDGAVWLRRGSFGLSEADWLRLSPTGRLNGVAKLDARIRVMAANADFLYGVRHNENDVPQVVRIAIQ